MSYYLVTEGCTLTGQTVAPNDTTITILPASITLPKLKCNGNKVYNTISYTATFGTYTGAGTLSANTTKVESTGLEGIMSNAQSTCTVVNGSSPFDSKTCTVTVQNAGQTKAKAV